jgi:hypothetical protein
VPPLAIWKICIYPPSRHPLFFFQSARFFLPIHGSSAQGASSTHGAQIFQPFSPWRRFQTRRPCSFFLAHAASPSSASPSRRKVQAPLLPPLTGVEQQLCSPPPMAAERLPVPQLPGREPLLLLPHGVHALPLCSRAGTPQVQETPTLSHGRPL